MSIRVALSSFWRKYKERIIYFFKRFGLIILIGISVAAVFSQFLKRDEQNSIESNNTVYNPTRTIISGGNIKQEEYKKEENLVKTFVDYCNNQKIQEAYDLLTDECKQKMYPNLESFKKNYYNIIFAQKRECNLQSWISDENSNTYWVTFIEDIMATGNYDNVEKFEDYITIVTKDGEQKLNVNGYVKTEEINKTTETDELEVTVKSADIYIENIKYYLEITNLTENDILLDPLYREANIKMVGTNNADYALDEKNLFIPDLVIYRNNRNKEVQLKFIKQYGSDIEGKNIKFKKLITNYDDYKKDSENYSDYKEVSIKLY